MSEEKNNELMRHTQEQVVEAFNFLSRYAQDDKYIEAVQIIVEYTEDLIQTCGKLKKNADDSADLLFQVMKKITEFNQPTSNQKKKQYIEKIRNARKIKMEKEEG